MVSMPKITPIKLRKWERRRPSASEARGSHHNSRINFCSRKLELAITIFLILGLLETGKKIP
jgi:hypothetical protein